MRALLVEDEGFTREGLVLLINNVMPELEVLAVGSLADAEKALAENEFSFVFLDIELGEERTGLDYLDELKERGFETPVIVLSNQDSREMVFESIRRGAFGFLPKQTEERSTIRYAVEYVLKGGVYLPPSVRPQAGMKVPPTQPGKVPAVRQATPTDLGLTPRVFEAVYWAAQGLRNKAIARKMGNISDNSVAEYLQKAYQRLDVENRVELITMLNRRAIHLMAPAAEAPAW